MEFFVIFFAVQIGFAAVQLMILRNLKRRDKKAQEKNLSIVRKNERLIHSAYLALENFTQTRPLPLPLLDIPLADKAGIVLDVKRVNFPSPTPSYNASIGFTEGKHYLFFRYDIPIFGKSSATFVSHIGSIQMDKVLNPLEETFCKIATGSPFSEDARFFQHGERNFLIYNDLVHPTKSLRGLFLAELNIKEQRLEKITRLGKKYRAMEKNWTPFSHEGDLHFFYEINQQKILKFDNEHILSHGPSIPTEWSKRWGLLRGGTPAILVDGQYLSFFHSSFEDQKGVLWYVMGAYTFEAKAPFKMTHISPHPILFNGIFDTPHQPLANPRIRSLYPAGIILQGDTIVVSCGENDSGVKLVTLGKRALFAGLKPV